MSRCDKEVEMSDVYQNFKQKSQDAIILHEVPFKQLFLNYGRFYLGMSGHDTLKKITER